LACYSLLKKAWLGATGARPSIFNTVRYSEKLLQASGVSVSTVDLSEMFGAARWHLGLCQYRRSAAPALLKMAKLGVAIDEWAAENEVNAAAFQCWTSIQKNYGINAGTLMSMMSDNLMLSACEVDVTGALVIYALQLASGRPSALVDWNNNYADEPDKCVLFHCGNWPRSFFSEIEMSYGEILATVLGQENTYGTVSAQAVPGPLTYARITPDDRHGKIKTYVGQGRIADDPLQTFGSRAVVEIPDLQKLMRHVCKNGYEHHAAMNPSHVAEVLVEAFETYMGWEVYHHQG
jgi:L-fucose isomerase-like protein